MKIKIIIFTALLCAGSSMLAKCLSCSERAALRKSIKDAVAAQLAAEQVALAKQEQDNEDKEKKEEQKDQDAKNSKKTQCCCFCALMGCDCQGKNSVERAPREAIVPETSPAFPTEPDCGCESIQEELCFLTEEIEELQMAIE